MLKISVSGNTVGESNFLQQRNLKMLVIFYTKTQLHASLGTRRKTECRRNNIIQIMSSKNLSLPEQCEVLSQDRPSGRFHLSAAYQKTKYVLSTFHPFLNSREENKIWLKNIK